MSLPVVVRPEAEADLVEAYRWYAERLPGLGEEFLRAVDAAMARIQRSPEAYPAVYKSVRRALLRRFPFSLFYILDADRIILLACFHARRNPRDWQKRT